MFFPAVLVAIGVPLFCSIIFLLLQLSPFMCSFTLLVSGNPVNKDKVVDIVILRYFGSLWAMLTGYGQPVIKIA